MSNSGSGRDDGERTVIIPSPGGSRRQQPGERTVGPGQPAPSTTPVPPPTPSAPYSDPAAIDGAVGDNPLLKAATTVFALARRLRHAMSQPDVPKLRADTVQLLRTFEGRAQQLGARPEAIRPASYALCALIDEIVLGTPWGAGSAWSAQSLLITLHNETTGGERFFQILHEQTANAATNIDMLELMFVCLSLGFRGKFGVMDRGMEQLERVEQGLYRTIRQQRGDFERALSPYWQGMVDPRPKVARVVPLWVVWAGVLGVLTVIFVGLSLTLNRGSDDAFVALSGLGREIPQLADRPAAPAGLVEPTATQTTGVRQAGLLRGVLAAQIGQGLVEVFDEDANTRITIRDPGMFASGSSSVSRRSMALLDEVAHAIRDLPGPILVIGHTDKVPIRTLRFPSTWHLSAARAEAVVEILAGTVAPPDKLIAEGRGDAQPVDRGDSPEALARNRRIEIKVPVY